MKVKICGITNLPDALFCEQYGADMLGFVFYNKSKRYIEIESAMKITERLSSETKTVGVFVNEQSNTINNTAEKLKLNFVQLHGDESPEILKEINYPVIKSFRINEKFDYTGLKTFKGAIPLLDTFSKGQYGGTGMTFNWEFIPDSLRKSIILAGGISVSNIGTVINRIKPYAVDLSSSLEFEPGKKDHIKVISFFNAIKSAFNK